MLLVGQISSLAITNAVFHKDGCVILMMTAVMALMNRDAPQVGTPYVVSLYCIWQLFSVALREYAENVIVVF